MAKKRKKELWQYDLELSKHNIEKYLYWIKKEFIELGITQTLQDLEVAIGIELEFTKLAGQAAYLERIEELLHKIQSNTNYLEDKSESYMPLRARSEELDKKFMPHPSIQSKRNYRTRIVQEPSYPQNTGQFNKLIDAGGFLRKSEPERVALSQGEIVSYPLSPFAAARWLCVMPEKMVKLATEYDLKRVTIKTRVNSEMLSNSIHLNMSVLAYQKHKDGVVTALNLFADTHNNTLSDLAICYSYVRNAFAKKAYLIFAPTEDCYQRFNDDVGPSHIGYFKRRESGNFGGAAWRGEGRNFNRQELKENGKVDKGILRHEERLPCVESIGHPNKTAYPEQQCLAYELVESQLYVLHKAISLWVGLKNDTERGDITPILRECKIYSEQAKVLHNVKEAEKLFLESAVVNEAFGDRKYRMVERYESLQRLNKRDFSSIVAERGQHINRSNFFTSALLTRAYDDIGKSRE